MKVSLYKKYLHLIMIIFTFSTLYYLFGILYFIVGIVNMENKNSKK